MEICYSSENKIQFLPLFFVLSSLHFVSVAKKPNDKQKQKLCWQKFFVYVGSGIPRARSIHLTLLTFIYNVVEIRVFQLYIITSINVWWMKTRKKENVQAKVLFYVFFSFCFFFFFFANGHEYWWFAIDWRLPSFIDHIHHICACFVISPARLLFASERTKINQLDRILCKCEHFALLGAHETISKEKRWNCYMG